MTTSNHPASPDDEPIRVRFSQPTHPGSGMAGEIYFKLFWRPIIGFEVAALYDLIWSALDKLSVANLVLTRKDVTAVLGLPNFEAVRPLTRTLMDVGLAARSEEGLTLINPLPRLSDAMIDEPPTAPGAP